MSGQTVVSAYFPLPGGATAFESASGKHFWHKDWLESVRFSSSIVNRGGIYDRAFAPFGEVYNNFGTTTNDDFTGDTQDLAVDLYDTPDRELHSNQGRWLSPDPLGVDVVDITDPQTWNRYAYAANNSLTLVDPTGAQQCGPGGVPSYGGGGCNTSGNFPCLICGIYSWDGLTVVRLNAGRIDSTSFDPMTGNVFSVASSPVYDYVSVGTFTSSSPGSDNWFWTATKSFFRDFSLFGPKKDPRPSCFGGFLKDSVVNFAGVPGIDTVAAAASTHYGIAQRFATQAVPNTRMARGGISPKQWLAADDAARVSKAGKFSLLVNADVAMAQAFFQNELPAALAGECK